MKQLIALLTMTALVAVTVVIAGDQATCSKDKAACADKAKAGACEKAKCTEATQAGCATKGACPASAAKAEVAKGTCPASCPAAKETTAKTKTKTKATKSNDQASAR